jgi:hypothetical protein
VSRRPGTADDRDVYRPKTPPAGVVTSTWHEQPTGVHSEPWLFRALKDLKSDIGKVDKRQAEQGEAIAEIRGKVDTLASFVPRPKSPSNGVSQMLLADKLDEGKVRRRFWLKIGGGLLLAIFGWLGHHLVG